jgi:hypothetical protein
MATWKSSGSSQDLSGMAKDSMWPSSMAGGNMASSNEKAMTAPGSDPVDPLPDRAKQGDPTVDIPESIPIGTSGKPKARAATNPEIAAARAAAAARWQKTSTPTVVRENLTG